MRHPTDNNDEPCTTVSSAAVADRFVLGVVLQTCIAFAAVWVVYDASSVSHTTEVLQRVPSTPEVPVRSAAVIHIILLVGLVLLQRRVQKWFDSLQSEAHEWYRRSSDTTKQRIRDEQTSRASERTRNRILYELSSQTTFDAAIRKMLRHLIVDPRRGFAVLVDTDRNDDQPIHERGLSPESLRSLTTNRDLGVVLECRQWVKLENAELRQSELFTSLSSHDRKKVETLHVFRVERPNSKCDFLITTDLVAVEKSKAEQLTFTIQIIDLLTKMWGQNRAIASRQTEADADELLLAVRERTDVVADGPRDRISQLIEHLRRILDVDRVSLFVPQHDQEMTLLFSSAASIPHGVVQAWGRHERRLAGECVNQGDLLHFDSRDLKEHGVDTLIGGALTSPVMHDGRMLAVVCMTSRKEWRASPRSKRLVGGCTQCIQEQLIDLLETDHRITASSPIPDTGKRKLQPTSRSVSPTKEIDESSGAAEEAVRAKGEFLATMSHEIRNPMNGILGMTQLALETDLTAQQREYLDAARSSSESLLTLVNDLLDFSKMEADRFQLAPDRFSLRSELKSIFLPFHLQAQEKDVGFSYDVDNDVPDQLIGDAGRLRQVIVNLTGNALKFTEAGLIAVQVSCQSKTDEEISLGISVRDTGIGIPDDRLPTLFERYTQVDPSTAARYGGTGLGLAISKQLVELMGGEIGAKSEAGRGSTFFFTVRVKRPRPEMVTDVSSKASEPGGGSCRPLNILLADDDRVNQRVALGVLEKHGHRVTAVNTGAEAVTQIRQNRFDVVLMDLEMPIMDGVSATKKIRAWESANGHPRITIIAMTGRTIDCEWDKCRKAGMNDFLTKPIDVSVLRETIERAVDRAPSDLRSADAPESAPDAVHYDSLLARVDGDAPLAQELLELFIAGCPEYVADIRRAMASRDARAVQRSIHKFQGAARNVSATSLVTATNRLDNATLESLEGAEQICQELEDAVELLRRELNTAESTEAAPLTQATDH